MQIRATVLILCLAASAVSIHGCVAQPKVRCTVSRASFAARYTLVSGTGACAELKGEQLGVQDYVPNPDAPGDGLSSMAIQSLEVGVSLANADAAGISDLNPDDKPYAFGKFSHLTPDGSGLCYVPALTPAALSLPDVPLPAPQQDAGADDAGTDDAGMGAAGAAGAGGDQVQPALELRYEWSNVRIAVSAAQTGTAWTADLNYTRNGCTARYHVAAVSPAVPCAGADGMPDSSLCSANPGPNYAGSGISPDIAVVCDTDLLLCVPATDQPF